MNNLNIFVSSTCYDLSQIRVDLSDFLKNSGHNPILSEFENFPISPELNTIENCIKIVKENADILVLVIGSRYGSIVDNGKSITNNEFLVAKQKGIPIFCFIDKSVLAALSFWRHNKDGNFSHIVDDPKIFQFIDDIRNNSKIWTFPFEKAQDIISTLKTQLSYLFKNSLKAKNLIDTDISDFFKLNLSNKALRIVLEKGEMFEYEFFGQVFVDEIEKKAFLRNDIAYSILIESKNYINDISKLEDWVHIKFKSLTYIIDSFNNLINYALPKFIAEQGVPSDLKGLYYVAVKYAELYQQLLNWIIEIRSTAVDEKFENLKLNISNFTIHLENEIWDFPFTVHNEIISAKNKVVLGEHIIIKLTLDFQINEEALEAFSKELKELEKTYYQS